MVGDEDTVGAGDGDDVGPEVMGADVGSGVGSDVMGADVGSGVGSSVSGTTGAGVDSGVGPGAGTVINSIEAAGSVAPSGALGFSDCSCSFLCN